MSTSTVPIKQLTRNFQHPRIVVFLIVSSLYCFSFAFLLDQLLPNGDLSVNRAFVDAAWKILLLAAGIIFLFVFFFSRIRGDKASLPQTADVSIKPADSLLVLLPLTPIVQYVLNNQNILSVTGSLSIIGVFAAFTIVISLIIPKLFAKFGLASTLMMTGIAFAFTIINMASLAASQNWFERGELTFQLAQFFAIFAMGTLVYSIVGRKFTYFIVVLYFVSNGFFNLLLFDKTDERSLETDPNNKLIQLTGSKKPHSTPNIYILVYDAYVASETMIGYGIDNRPQEEYLADKGFKLYPHTYSVSAFSVGTMSRVFSVTTGWHGKPRTAVSGDGPVQRLLQGFGYKTYGLFPSDYFFQTNGSSYDYSFPELQATHAFRGSKATHWMITKAILMGEFRFDIEFGSPSHQDFLDRKTRAFSEDNRSPKFVYIHDNRPGHSQNSGACRTDETELFANRLGIANTEMKKNITAIERDDPNAIVVVAGDHGPYLTKNCTDTGGKYKTPDILRLDVQDRYGSFLAIKWPPGNRIKYDDIVIIQDVFPAIFATIFDDAQYLQTRIKPNTLWTEHTSSVSVLDGVIKGGANDGESLFLTPRAQ
jgi:hypothetical protein